MFVPAFYLVVSNSSSIGETVTRTVVTKVQTDSVTVTDVDTLISQTPPREGYPIDLPAAGFSFVLETPGSVYPLINVAGKTYQRLDIIQQPVGSFRIAQKPEIRVSRAQQYAGNVVMQFTSGSWDEFFHLPWQALLLVLTRALGGLIIILLVTYHCKRFFDQIAEQDYFGASQIRQLRIIGWAFVAYGLLDSTHFLLTNLFSGSLLEREGLGLNPAVALLWPHGDKSLLLGSVILVLTQIFAYGQQLKQDQELTI